jgi:hypothetical protein
MMAERDGVHCTSTLKLVKRKPSEASRSSRGVAAPRMIPPPLKPGSPQPKLSRKTSTILGFSSAKVKGAIDAKINTTTTQNAFNDLIFFSLYIDRQLSI